MNVYVDFFTVFDSVFSNSCTSVGNLSEVKEEETFNGIALGLKMWRDLDMSVLPKLMFWKIIYILSCLYSKVLEITVRILWNKHIKLGCVRRLEHRIAEIHCLNEHKHSLPAVKNIQAVVAEKYSQNQTHPQVMNAKQRQKVERVSVLKHSIK